MKRIVATIAWLVALAVAGGGIVLWTGLINVAAVQQHLGPVYWLLEVGMRRSVATRARDVVVPPLGDPAQLARGLYLFDRHCVQCHGGPGVAPAPFALGMTPPAANLVHTARDWDPAEIYWVVRNGVRMTGMPGWEFRLADDDLWSIVAFIETLPTMTPTQYAQAVDGIDRDQAPLSAARPGAADPRRGRVAVHQYACVTCHEIAGTVSSEAPVGPPLARLRHRTFLSGTLPNTPDNLERWLRDPHAVDARTAMPDLHVSERDARDMAAYLMTLD